MIKTKDVLIEIAIIFFWFFFSIILIAIAELPFLVLPLFIVFIMLKIYLKRRKKILEFVKDDFQKLDYELIEERPTTFSEYFINTKLELKSNILINDVPRSRYKYIRAFRRIFKAKAKDGTLYELNSSVLRTWDSQNKIKIIDIKRFRN